MVQRHLVEAAGFDGTINPNDKVCYTCYKSHLVIMQENRLVSKDSELQLLINTYKHNSIEVCKLADLQAVNHTTVMVGEELLQKNILHLPAIHDFLCDYADTLTIATNLDERGDIRKLVTNMWVLSMLTANLQHHIIYRCPVRKYGTLVLRPNTDPIPSLQRAMWKLRQLESTSSSKASETTIRSQHLDDLNQRVHRMSQKIQSRDYECPFEQERLDIDKCIEEVDPEVWHTICLLTRSVSEKRGTSPQAALDPNSTAYHTKKTRRFFLVCMLLFCTDDRCSTLMHVLVTDVVDSQGGSALLIRLLNRLGVCGDCAKHAWFKSYEKV